MEAIMEKISKREKTEESFSSQGFMPRVFEVRAPCSGWNIVMKVNAQHS